MRTSLQLQTWEDPIRSGMGRGWGQSWAGWELPLLTKPVGAGPWRPQGSHIQSRQSEAQKASSQGGGAGQEAGGRASA